MSFGSSEGAFSALSFKGAPLPDDTRVAADIIKNLGKGIRGELANEVSVADDAETVSPPGQRNVNALAGLEETGTTLAVGACNRENGKVSFPALERVHCVAPHLDVAPLITFLLKQVIDVFDLSRVAGKNRDADSVRGLCGFGAGLESVSVELDSFDDFEDFLALQKIEEAGAGIALVPVSELRGREPRHWILKHL